MSQILNSVWEEKKKITALIFDCRLSYAQACQYLNTMLGMGLLRENEDRLISITPEGTKMKNILDKLFGEKK